MSATSGPAPAALAAALADRYRLERELGAGGMATVYLAHDLKHDRDVAIKVLHEDLGATLGPERFLAEIKTTAKLQHPHILPLLDSGASAGVLYYVMPYVAGETLRDRLTRETQLPIEDAVRIAREVADALAHAHGHGIIHRDIKPENILLQGGHAVVADFGIALAVQHAGGARLTQTGLSLGTPQYMAPEQAMGEKSVGPSADIYALGAVTYEMLTGEPPFTGATVQAVVAKVLSDRPTPPSMIRDTVPPYVEAAVLKALAKLPADRWTTPDVFAGALSLAQGDGLRTAAESVRGAQRTTRRSIIVAVVGGLALIASGWALRALTAGTQAGGARTTRLSVSTPPGVTLMTTNTPALALSRDGALMAYTTSRGLEIRDLNAFSSRVIEMPEGATAPFFSPDGNWVGYTSGVNMWKVDSRGGRPIQLATGWAYYATWGDDDRIYYTPDIGGAGIAVMNADGSGQRQLTRPDSARGEAFHQSPEYLPGGTLLYTAAGPTGGWGSSATLMALDLPAKAAARVVLKGASAPHFLAPDHLIYLDETGQVVTRSFDPRTATVSGAPTVLDSVRSTHWGGVAHVAASREGTVAYIPGSERSKTVIVERDESGRQLRRLHSGNQFRPALSPDGRTLAFSDFNGRESQIITIDLATLNERRETFGNTLNESSIWSADGRRFLYGRQTLKGGREIVMHSVDVKGKDSVLFGRKAQLFVEAWSPDGRWVVYLHTERANNSLYVADLMQPDVPRLVTENAYHADLSRDGHWLVYCVTEADGPRLYMVSFPDLARRSQVTSQAACAPRFSADGLTLYYVDRAEWVNRMGMLHLVHRAGPDATTWTGNRTLFPAFGHPIAIERNPTRFILVEPDSSRLAREIRVITGWRPEATGARKRPPER